MLFFILQSNAYLPHLCDFFSVIFCLIMSDVGVDSPIAWSFLSCKATPIYRTCVIFFLPSFFLIMFWSNSNCAPIGPQLQPSQHQFLYCTANIFWTPPLLILFYIVQMVFMLYNSNCSHNRRQRNEMYIRSLPAWRASRLEMWSLQTWQTLR